MSKPQLQANNTRLASLIQELRVKEVQHVSIRK